MRILTVLPVAALLAAPIAAATAQSQAVDRAVAAWAKIHTMRGSFEQTVTNPLLGSSATARGAFAQQRPNKLAVRFSSPAGDAIVADGTNLWVYLQQAAPGQVMKRPMTDRMAMPIDVGQFLDAPSSKYDITAKGAEAVGGRPAQVLGLVPKKGTSAPFTRATVWIDDADGLIRQFEVAESSGIIRRIRLSSIEVNPAIPGSEFRFTVPKGVKIVGR
jgi:outer membrane lipoprotein carrier protein